MTVRKKFKLAPLGGASGAGAGAIGACFDGSGAALTTSGTTRVLVRAPRAGTITEASIVTRGGASGDITVGIKKSAYASFPGGLTDITGGADLEITSSDKVSDTTLAGWTLAVAAGDVFEFELKSVSTFTHTTVLLFY